jgi:aspartate/methionine/tyrosine aminotransferase
VTVTAPSRIRDIELPPFDPLNVRAAALRAAGHRVISLGQALPFFDPPQSALNAARAALQTREVNLYVTDPGLPALRSVLAERLETVGIAASADDIIITAGANHAFTLALTTLVDPGDEVVLPAPFFTNHQMAIAALGAHPVEAPVRDRATFRVHWSDIEPFLGPRTRAVVLCNPSNPTGAALDAAEGARIVGELASRGIVLFSDETYLHFVYARSHWSAATSPVWRRNVVVIGTFSKAFGMMGWRVGFMLADASVCAQAVKVQDAMIICAPAIGQAAALAAVRDDWNYARSFHAEFLARREALIEGVRSVKRLHWTPADGAFFGFVRVDGCESSAALAQALLEDAHVVTIPGSAFGASGEGHLRLSYGSAGIGDVSDAMRRIAAFFKG